VVRELLLIPSCLDPSTHSYDRRIGKLTVNAQDVNRSRSGSSGGAPA
jgi:hypothetical protein